MSTTTQHRMQGGSAWALRAIGGCRYIGVKMDGEVVEATTISSLLTLRRAAIVILKITGLTPFENIEIKFQPRAGEWRRVKRSRRFLSTKWILSDKQGRVLDFEKFDEMLLVLQTTRNVADYRCDRN